MSQGTRQKCETVLELLLERDAVSRDAYASLQNDLEQNHDRNVGSVLGRELLSNGIASEDIAECYAQALALPILGSSVEVAASGDDWALGEDSVCYMLNPLDVDRFQDLLRSQNLSIRAFGVLAYHQLDQINRMVDQGEVLTSRDNISARRQLEKVIEKAIVIGASDIHLEPVKDRVDIRYRTDGMVYKFASLALGEQYLSLANLILEDSDNNAGEYIEPRDGQFPWELRHRSINIRMSMVPSRVGQGIWPRFTLRLLGLELELVDLSRLGLSEHAQNNQLREIKRSLSETSGLIIVSGPTGSGKTTTLNASMRWLTRNMPTKTYFAVEDPVEVENPQVTQVEVNVEANVTFASALRAFLRQDPDVIMVGEIRDHESMGLATRASLTGHLVLTSMHTKSALGGIARMLDMGAEPDLLSDALSGLMAQRTIRAICPSCCDYVSIDQYIELDHPYLSRLSGIFRDNAAETRQRYGDLDSFPGAQDKVPVACPEGCKECRRGYRGRTVIAEFVSIDQTMKDMISDRASRASIETYARSRGFKDIWDHAMQKVVDGESTFQEIERAMGQRRSVDETHLDDEQGAVVSGQSQFVGRASSG